MKQEAKNQASIKIQNKHQKNHDQEAK
jgi:hypothetical protein